MTVEVIEKDQSSDQGFTEAEVETMKLFDQLQFLRQAVEKISAGDKDFSGPLEYDGRKLDSGRLAAALLGNDLKRFKEIVDTRKPFYARFISECEQLPFVETAMKVFDEDAAASA